MEARFNWVTVLWGNSSNFRNAFSSMCFIWKLRQMQAFQNSDLISMKHSQRWRGTSNTHHIIRISSFFYNAGRINFPSQRATWWRWVRKNRCKISHFNHCHKEWSTLKQRSRRWFQTPQEMTIEVENICKLEKILFIICSSLNWLCNMKSV